ncbi:uncharacterized protein PHACADRAFT_201948 [Phanerochaete carnosa HHB-10118-sp]|uniref:Uncharacterized protein n=1 Tax=Phanerochaete carnosa (strain HHB-10118-sp) TaxID=650164 RepID=K5VDG0_PHACS|nr:uncharacterized protein PHACADRAFT_201948 [Phanerochaete carnosa HHB-10118-sp]EKM49168.1 hypothetical protein PHACADRAFT_201948 [Phanerochaete carnosa HHB-10118-sp]
MAEMLSTFRCVLLTDKYVGISAWESFMVDCFKILVETYNLIILHPLKNHFNKSGTMILGQAIYSSWNIDGLTLLLVSLTLADTAWTHKLPAAEVDMFWQQVINVLDFADKSSKMAQYLSSTKLDILIHILYPFLTYRRLFDNICIDLYSVLFELYIPTDKQSRTYLVTNFPLINDLRWFNLFV